MWGVVVVWCVWCWCVVCVWQDVGVSVSIGLGSCVRHATRLNQSLCMYACMCLCFAFQTLGLSIKGYVGGLGKAIRRRLYRLLPLYRLLSRHLLVYPQLPSAPQMAL